MNGDYHTKEEYDIRPKLARALGHKLIISDDIRDTVTNREIEVKTFDKPRSYFANGWARVDSVSLDRHKQLHGDSWDLLLRLTDCCLIARGLEVLRHAILETNQAYRTVQPYKISLLDFKELKL